MSGNLRLRVEVGLRMVRALHDEERDAFRPATAESRRVAALLRCLDEEGSAGGDVEVGEEQQVLFTGGAL